MEKNYINKNWSTLAVGLVAMSTFGQVSNYVFSSSTETYTPLENPTVVVEATASDAEDQGYHVLPDKEIPVDFLFNGNTYHSVNIYADGFITFGDFVTDAYHYKPLSYAHPHEAVLACFNDDLSPLQLAAENKYGKISYKVIGTAPNRSFVIQWENYTRYNWQGYNENHYELNFQIALNEDQSIDYKYDVDYVGSEADDRFITVGFRGATMDDFVNRESQGPSSWTSTVPGDQHASTIYTSIDNGNLPPSGLVYHWEIPSATSYCTPYYEYMNAGAEPITYIEFNTLTNTTSEVYADLLPHYEDYSSMSTNVMKGNTYTLKLKGNTVGNNTNYFVVFIDWNHDGTFDTDNEEYITGLPTISNSTGIDNQMITHDITIPQSAMVGNTRMRIIKNYSGEPIQACEQVGDYGQVQDYTLVVEEDNGSSCNAPGTTIGDLGCVSGQYNGTTVEYTTVRAADGNVWLQQNIGSTQVATSIDDTDSYGDLFQWGRWDDGHQLRTSASSETPPSPNNPSGLSATTTDFYIGTDNHWWVVNDIDDTWQAMSPADVSETNGIDPCKKIFGEDWSLPSKDDWQNIKETEQITNKTTAFESNLKLPAAGYRSYSTGALEFEGTKGYYWSNTTSNTGARYFYLSSIANPNAGGKRAQGASVRCVNKTNTTGIPTQTIENVTVYPNPTSDWLYVQTNQSIKRLSIYDLNGKKIEETTNIPIHVSEISNGIYILQIEWSNGQKTSRKIMKK